MTFGFIITRHVNSEMTNKYWNRCIQCIRYLYHYDKYKIVVIDDNSDQNFIKSEFDYKNVEYVQSEFPKRGELLPYYYFYKNHYFDNAVIIHDSVFLHKKVNFNRIKIPVLPLWHFDFGKEENFNNSLRIASCLTNNYLVKKRLLNQEDYTVLLHKFVNNTEWNGCFGVQCYINYNFLCKIKEKYNLFNMLNTITCRSDRCCLERIMGVIFNLECSDLIKVNSLLGVITKSVEWGYSYEEYVNDIVKNKKPKYPIVKVWTGR